MTHTSPQHQAEQEELPPETSLELAGADPDPFSRLETVAQLVEAALPPVDPPDPHRGTSWAVGITTQGNQQELTAMLLDGHPAQVLRGFRAPKHWEELALVTTGTALHIDDGTAQRAHLVWVCGRDGRGVSVLRIEDEEPHTVRLGPAPEDHLGLVADVMRRALGLATAPCTEPLRVLLAVTWLERILPVAGERQGGLSWADAAVLHPAYDLMNRCSVEGSASATDLATLTTDLENNWTWERVRWAVATGVIPVPGIEPEHASWFDEGSFARATLAERPTLRELLEGTEAIAPVSVTSQIRQVIESPRQADGEPEGWIST